MLVCDFEKRLTELERQKWSSVKAIMNNFLGKTKSRNHKHLIANMLQKFQKIKVNFFQENMGIVSDKHVERFRQDIAPVEKRFKSKCSENASADYCWNLMTDEANAHHRQACRRKIF